MTEYTSMETSARLNAAGFRIRGDTIHWEVGFKITDPGEHYWRYRTDTLLAWLMTKPYFSRRAATIQIAFRVAEDINGEHTACYFVTALSGTGREIGHGEDPVLPDALAKAVLMILGVR
jgi:hypothetical protein